MENLVDNTTLQSYYRHKKVFVTGHTGFKGSWLISWLHLLGANVKGYALEPEYDECLFNLIKPLDLAGHVVGDIRNKDFLTSEVLDFQPDYIFHLAAQPLVRRSYKIPAETFNVNVTGTANLLEAATLLPKKCTIVVITTDKVYSNKENETLYKETDILGGYDPYSASKACTEIVTCSFRDSFFNLEKFEEHKKAVATARAGNVIGGGDYSEDRIVPDIVRALRTDQVIEVRNPSSVRPWQHVLEPLGGYLLLGGRLSESPLVISGAYNFGPFKSDHLTVKELVDLSISAWSSGKWLDTSSSKSVHEASLLKLDISKANDVLSWQPKLNATEAVSWTINWYKQKDHLAEFTFNQITEYMAL